MLAFDPITTLADEHVALAQLFARHQEALVTRAWARAARLLDHYQKRLQYQIQLEERFLLPYCVEEKAPGQWQARVYMAEHRRLEELLHKAGVRLAAARRRGVTSAGLIALLDEEKTLKHVVEYHYQREEIALFSILRQSLPEEVRTGLVHVLMQHNNIPHAVEVSKEYH
ncbi:MAG: hemerythrin domain-containing protein [Gammaproteobacteria bacterium]